VIIHPQFPGGYAVFSDDIRHELLGKITVVGQYSGEMQITAEGPVLIPLLCVSIFYRDDPASFPKDLVVIVSQKGTDEVELAKFAVQVPVAIDPIVMDPPLDEDGIVFAQVYLEARISPFHVKENCRVNVRAYYDDKEIRLGSLAVKLLPPVVPQAAPGMP